MKHSIRCATVAMALGIVAGAAGQSRADFSDSMTVFDPTGAVFAQVGATEATEVANGPFFLYYMNLDPTMVDPSQFGNPTVVLEADGTHSDIFGIATGGPNSSFDLFFASDVDGSPVNYGNFPLMVPEGNGILDASLYLDQGLVALGWRAEFQSRDVPEPTSIALLAVGGLGLVTYVRRRRRAAVGADLEPCASEDNPVGNPTASS